MSYELDNSAFDQYLEETKEKNKIHDTKWANSAKSFDPLVHQEVGDGPITYRQSAGKGKPLPRARK
jgi:hypothetical protein